MYRHWWTLRILIASSVLRLEPNGRRNNECYYVIERKCCTLKGMIATPLSFPLNNSNRWVWWMQPRRDAATPSWERTNWFSGAIQAFQAPTSDFQLILLNFLPANYKLGLMAWTNILYWSNESVSHFQYTFLWKLIA